MIGLPDTEVAPGQPFSISDEHRALGWMLQSEGWIGVVRPVIAERVRALYAKLLDPSKKRKEGMPDDFIRGEIAALKWMIEWPEQAMSRVAAQMREQDILNAELNQTNGASTVP